MTSLSSRRVCEGVARHPPATIQLGGSPEIVVGATGCHEPDLRDNQGIHAPPHSESVMSELYQLGG